MHLALDDRASLQLPIHSNSLTSSRAGRSRSPRGNVFPGAAGRVQVRDQVGSPAQAGRELHRHPQGGLLQVTML